MLPLYLLTNAKGQQLSVELKNGEIVEGELVNVDNWMNLTLSNVSQYDTIGNSGNIAAQKEIVKSKEVYLRGTYIKYIKLQDGVIDQVKQQISSGSGSSGAGSGSHNRKGNRYGSGGSGSGGNYKRGGNQNKRNYNSNSVRRSYQQNRPSSGGMGGYVQQHQPQRDSPSGNIEF
ncbi:hypothetical protein HG537_0B04500 [Torulaspora globosa]|uniref:LSM complex subunit LSM4 n=1 Tax=Torulaspora globosa TaxID=48254 RepID=A0A7H9HRY5_9SACH|nr:hypothetical protein HG537_0B04500 [Torulaspora sp. CBS 2947]